MKDPNPARIHFLEHPKIYHECKDWWNSDREPNRENGESMFIRNEVYTFRSIYFQSIRQPFQIPIGHREE